MNFIYERGKKNAMHIQKHTASGQPLMEALCGIERPFNTTINAPFRLGKKLCVNCEREANQ